jgi:hypothetical protein
MYGADNTNYDEETETTYTRADKAWYAVYLSTVEARKYATGKKTTLGKKPRTKTASRRAAKGSRP